MYHNFLIAFFLPLFAPLHPKKKEKKKGVKFYEFLYVAKLPICFFHRKK
jgi:hypothetical protein